MAWRDGWRPILCVIAGDGGGSQNGGRRGALVQSATPGAGQRPTVATVVSDPDHLLVQQKPIEKELFLRLRNLFSLNVDLVFYDLTSTYFEGNGPVGFALHGHSRDGKPRNRQVLVGVVMIDGWPIAHHVFHGNLRDSTTVEKVLQDLQSRFGLRRVVFVGDRGMVRSGNLDRLRSSGQGYLVGLKRRRQPEILRYLEGATGPWLECPAGISAREKSQVPKTLVQEVACGKAGVRVFVVHSEERLEYQHGEREKAMQKVQEELEALEQRVAQGKLKAPEKIGAAASRVLSRHHGFRYYTWELKQGQFHYFEHARLRACRNLGSCSLQAVCSRVPRRA
jgi:transposase